MSKLSQAIKAKQTNARFPKKIPLLTNAHITEAISSHAGYFLFGYELEVSFRANFQASSNDEDDYNVALSNARSMIINQVFGEFREPLYLLQDALYNQEIEKAKSIASGIFNQMFKDGI